MGRPRKPNPGGYLAPTGRRYRCKADARKDTPEWVHGQVEGAERHLRHEARKLRKSIVTRRQDMKRNFEHKPDEELIALLDWAARTLVTAAESIQNALFKRGLA